MGTPTPTGFLQGLLGRIRSPWLTVLLALLLVIDLVLPDPLPFVDEAVLALLTVLAASWRRRGPSDPSEPPLDVTPRE
jgi:hypothetical protein